MLPPIIILGALLWGCSSDPEPIFSSADSDGPDAKPDHPDSFGGIDNDSDFETDEAGDGAYADFPERVETSETTQAETSDSDLNTPDLPEVNLLPPDNDGDNYFVCANPAEDLAVLNAGGLCGDCDDTRDFSYLGAPERIDGRDTNCDGSKEMNLIADAVAFIGEADGDEAGNNAMAMGDINGGGDDVVIGSGIHSTQPFFYEGKVYVKFGGAVAPQLGTKVYLGTDSDVIFNGAGGWGLGGSLATRDLSGDGKAEILMSASGFNNGQCGGACGDGDGSESGALVLIRGREVWKPVYNFYDIDVTDTVALSDHQMAIVLGKTDTAGDSLVSFQMLEDIDGNSTPEILLRTGNTQHCNIIPALAYEGIRTVGEIMAIEKSYQIFGGGAEDVCNNVAGADVNGDGFADILMGDPGGFNNNDKGKVYLLYGAQNLPTWPNVINLKQLTALSPIDFGTFEGASQATGAGETVELADLNGDGKSEILIGALLEDGPGIKEAGRIHIIDGGQYTLARQGLHPKVTIKNGGNLVLDSSIFELGGKAIYGDVAGATLPNSMSAADTNGDDAADLIAGAGFYLDGGGGKGFYFDGASLMKNSSNMLVAHNADQLMSDDLATNFGLRLMAGGDPSGDDVADVLINATSAPSGTSKGVTYLFLGAK